MNIRLIFALVVLPVYSFADAPDWSVNPLDFTGSSEVRAELFVDEVLATDPTNMIGAFIGGECRGVANPVNVLDSWIFFLTVYGDTNGETLSFQTYVNSEDLVVPIEETLVYNSGAFYGSAFDPIALNAIIYLDHAPIVAGIPDQTINFGDAFADFDLDDYLTELDGHSIDWSASGQSELVLLIDGDNVISVVLPYQGWTGNEIITFTATDLTPSGLFGSDTAVFTVLTDDHPPVVEDIPDQIIQTGNMFPDIFLDDYLTELDGDAIGWSYHFLPPLVPHPDPGWVVDPNDFELSMTLTARVIARGQEPDFPGNQLAAFVGDECRGLITPVFAIDTWFYFLNIYANVNGEEITLRYYDADNQVQIPIAESYSFTNNAAFGSPLDPEILHAEFIRISIDEFNVASAEIVDPEWLGSETVVFTATDLNTANNYAASDLVTYTNTGAFDLPPFLIHIPDQFTDEGVPFDPIYLDDYLLELDGDPVFWTAGGSTDLIVSIDPGNVLVVTAPDDDWFGSEEIIVIVTDDTPPQLSDIQIVRFTVTPVNDAPRAIATLPDIFLDTGQSLQFDADIFMDPEDNPISYSLGSSDESRVTVDMNGNTGIVSAINPGVATVTIYADDGLGGIGTYAIQVTVSCLGLIDCFGDCYGTAYEDDCGECVAGNTGMLPDWAKDCSGECFGNALIDACDVCAGGSTGIEPNVMDQFGFVTGPDADCNGDCFGSAALDDCQICSGGDSGHVANSDIDVCNVCPDGTFGIGADTAAPGNYQYGNGPDCNGECFGDATGDACGICSGGSSGLEPNIDDGTGFITGPDADCNGDCFGSADIDDCLVCSGGNTGHEPNSDKDCNGDCFGDALLDACEICAGGSTGLEPNIADDENFVTGPDADCNGDCFGSAALDDCQVCSGGNSGHEANSDKDCYGDCFGQAMFDDCDVCSGGDTGLEFNADLDCNENCFGSAFLDDCQICSGGNSGHEANSDLDICNVCPDGTMGLGSDEPALDYTYLDGPDCNEDCFGTAYMNICGCVEGATGLDPEFCYGCTDIMAMNYDEFVSLDDGSCIYNGDCNGDGTIDVSDIVQMIWLILYPED